MKSIFRREYLTLVFLQLFFAIAVACSDGTKEMEKRDVVPILLSTIPSSGATDLESELVDIKLNYDMAVAIKSPFIVELNNENVAVEATLSNNTVGFQLTNLEPATSYEIVVPQGNVFANNEEKRKAERAIINFRTMPESEVITSPLVSANPTKEAVSLYNYLLDINGKQIISCAMSNVSWNKNEAEWVKLHTGLYPAMIGLDYIKIYSEEDKYNDLSVVKDWWQNNGLVTICWHWSVPKYNGSDEYEFYTYKEDTGKGTKFDISKVDDETSYEYKTMVKDMETIADNLLKIQYSNIPILWRPLHEASGGWFWWGAKGAEPFKKVWRLMFDVFQRKGVNNLIWVWTSEVSDEAWYPGDEYVDVIGRDKYRVSASALNQDYAKLKALYPEKLVTLSEFGNITGDDDLFKYGQWSWFMPWYDYNRTKDLNAEAFQTPEHIYISNQFWNRAFANTRVLSLDEMPSLK